MSAPDRTDQPDEPGQAGGTDTPDTAGRADKPERAADDQEATGTETARAASRMPEYKGEPLDAERGPGLGCFWIQVALLTFFLIFTPLTVTWGWDPFFSAALLIFTLILLLFSGQTVIFLLRLVAADRRARRTPLDPKAKPTVGQMEELTPEPTRTAADTPVDADGTGPQPRDADDDD